MKLRRLEIAGFKSFADYTVLDFNANITGIIGPTRCGKSNVVDAIRWVMGELSAKQLRGSAMADVVFAGSEARGPLGLAEVTLTLSSEEGESSPLYKAYEEIAVTRRLFSSGDSEYLINKTKVRLRDIQDLFMDTGVGTKGAYAIIEQGRIGSILLGQPEERRRMIDEVAGISKFKARRQGAERRLETTRQSMERLNDLVSDLKRRVSALKKQAEVARRYKELKAQIAEIEQYELVMRYLEAVSQSSFLNKELALWSDGEAELALSLTTAETKLTALMTAKSSEEDKLRQLEAIKQHMVTRLATLERDILHGREEIAAAKEREENLAHDAAEAKEQLVRFDELSQNNEKVLQELETAIAQKEAVFAEKQANLQKFQQQHQELQRQADSLSVALLEAVESVSKEQNTLEMLERQKAELARRKEQSEIAIAQLQEEQKEAAEQKKSLQKEIDIALSIIENYNFEHDDLKSATERLEAKLKSGREELSASERELTRRRSRFESLTELERRHDGYNSGIKALLDKKKGQGEEVLLLKDLFTIPSELEVAAEAFWGEYLQYMVLGQEEALAALATLKAEHLGKAGFLLTMPLPPALITKLPAEILAASGVLGSLYEKLMLSPEGEFLAPYLAGVVLVENLDKAMELQPLLAKYQLKAVTLDGDILENGVILRGGAKEAVVSGLLARKREIALLSAELERLEAEERQKAELNRGLEEDIEKRKVRLSELVDSISRENLKRIAKEKEKQAAIYAVERVSERLELMAYELEESQKESANFAARTALCLEKIAQAEKQKMAVIEAQQALKENNSALAAQIEALSEECAMARINLAEFKQKLEAAMTAQRGEAKSREELLARLARLWERQQKEAQSAEERRRQLIKDEEEQKLYQEQHIKAAEEVAAQAAAIAALSEKIGLLDLTVKKLTDEHQAKLEKITALRLQLGEWQSEIARLSETASTFYQHDISELVYLYHLRPLPTGKTAEAKKSAQAELGAIGPNINLLAIEECAKEEEKLNFFTAQRGDLEQAMKDLAEAVLRIEQNSRARFQNAFTAVNEAFKKVFVKLFNGGQAELLLLEGETPLDGGLDIIAQPPGKKLQNLTLLSGGEKALTAAALVFALFLVRPSPFCLLDEVDAPLDEANIGRFLDLIKELSSETQFVIITHNQQSMAAADVVYGVTMEERGVSKVLSIKLNERAD